MLPALVGTTRCRRVQILALFFAFICFSIPLYIHSLKQSDGLQPSWSSAQVWVESADCARRSGAVLVLCREGQLVPIANASAGDDPGQALALGVYSIVTQKIVTQNDISRLNSTINFVGLVLLGALLFYLRLPVTSFLVLTGGAVIANGFHSLGPHPGQLGTACLAALLPLSILGIPIVTNSRRVLLAWIAVGVVALAAAMLLREAIGLMGVLTSFFAIGIGFLNRVVKRRFSAFFCLGLIGAVLLSLAFPEIVLRARNFAYDILPSSRMEQHGAWHNLFIGLGVVENSFGIEWLDEYAFNYVKSINPSIQFGSKEYYSTLKDEYFAILAAHPFDVVVVYLKKFAIALIAYPIFLILFLVSAVSIIVYQYLYSGEAFSRSTSSVLIVNTIFVCAFFGQAMLIHPKELYLFPIKLFYLMSVGVAMELFLLQNFYHHCRGAGRDDVAPRA